MTMKIDTIEINGASTISCRSKCDIQMSCSSFASCLDNIEHQSDTVVTKASSSINHDKSKEFTSLRLTYVLVTMVIMLADGLQGTHLYVLYDGYGFSVASLYALGFVAGAITTPITGPLIDKFGRKKSALLYCILEIWINMLEQYPILIGLIVSRVVGGITTNLLSSVFEAWLDTEYRRRGLDSKKYEIIMRDAVVVSNVSAIASGYLAHILAEQYGAVGPFRGAVTCTAVALVVVFALWNENFGDHESSSSPDKKEKSNEDTYSTEQYQSKKGLQEFIHDTVSICCSDSRVLRIGIIQGLTAGSLQTFVFLWSPTLQAFARYVSKASSLGLDDSREPAYGLIFGAFMAAGVAGGFLSPLLRKVFSSWLSLWNRVQPDDESESRHLRPLGVEIQAACCYALSAGLLLVPCMVSPTGELSFIISLTAFLFYELLIGIMMPCEGVIRSLYLPATARATMMSLPRIIVNVAVACGVIMTKRITTQSAFAAVSFLMFAAAILQLSLLTTEDWKFVFGTHDSVLRSTIITATTTTTSLSPTKRRSSVPSLAESVSIGDISTSDHDEEEDVEEEEEDWNRSTVVVDEVAQHQQHKLKTD